MSNKLITIGQSRDNPRCTYCQYNKCFSCEHKTEVAKYDDKIHVQTLPDPSPRHTQILAKYDLLMYAETPRQRKTQSLAPLAYKSRPQNTNTSQMPVNNSKPHNRGNQSQSLNHSPVRNNKENNHKSVYNSQSTNHSPIMNNNKLNQDNQLEERLKAEISRRLKAERQAKIDIDRLKRELEELKTKSS